jgi:hypothetical protein
MRLLQCKACQDIVALTRVLSRCACGRSAARNDRDGRTFILGPARVIVEDADRWSEADESVDVRRPIAPLL